MGTKALLSRRFELPEFFGCLAVFSIGLLAATCCPAAVADKILDAETLCEQRVQAAPSIGLFEAANAALHV